MKVELHLQSPSLMMMWECLNVGVLEFVLLENPILKKPRKAIKFTCLRFLTWYCIVLGVCKVLMKRGWRWFRNVTFLSVIYLILASSKKNIFIKLVPELFLYLSNRFIRYIKNPSNKSLNCLIRYQIDPWSIYVQN